MSAFVARTRRDVVNVSIEPSPRSAVVRFLCIAGRPEAARVCGLGTAHSGLVLVLGRWDS